MTDPLPRHTKRIVWTLLSPSNFRMSWKRNRLECTSQKSAKKRVSRNARLGEFCDFLLPSMSSEKVPASTPQFTFPSDVYPSVGKYFRKQSAEHPTPLDQPIVQYGTPLVGLIYFEKSMILTVHLSTGESPKAASLLSEVLADKAWGHSYSPTQTAFNKSTGYPETLFTYFEKVNTLPILFYFKNWPILGYSQRSWARRKIRTWHDWMGRCSRSQGDYLRQVSRLLDLAWFLGLKLVE